MMEIGFIGLGIMGSRMAANLLKAGYSLTVYNRSKQPVEELARQGARTAESPRAVGEWADILFTMLSTPEVVESLALDEDGFLAAMKPGTIWADCSTVNPSFSRRMSAAAQEAGVRFLDAPVAGSKAPAEMGQLTFLVGGEAADVDACRPLFAVMGQKVVHAGGVGMGISLKLIFNLLLGEMMVAFSEGLKLAEGLGLDRSAVFDALTGTAVVSPAAIGKRKKIEAADYSPEFPLQWLQKDMQMMSIAAYEQGLALPVTNLVKEIYMLAAQNGYAELDFSSIYQYLKGNLLK
jgi:3-hydroxyisobutyrate dehydrogenase-like beta-hydroxyacid dehydrogenase